MASIAILCCNCLKKTYADKATAWQSGKSIKRAAYAERYDQRCRLERRVS
jgi:hypothetical protein